MYCTYFPRIMQLYSRLVSRLRHAADVRYGTPEEISSCITPGVAPFLLETGEDASDRTPTYTTATPGRCRRTTTTTTGTVRKARSTRSPDERHGEGWPDSWNIKRARERETAETDRRKEYRARRENPVSFSCWI